jgi:hypothetical protein
VVVVTQSVIPAKAGIQGFRVQQRDAQADALDSRLRGNDDIP